MDERTATHHQKRVSQGAPLRGMCAHATRRLEITATPAGKLATRAFLIRVANSLVLIYLHAAENCISVRGQTIAPAPAEAARRVTEPATAITQTRHAIFKTVAKPVRMSRYMFPLIVRFAVKCK